MQVQYLQVLKETRIAYFPVSMVRIQYRPSQDKQKNVQTDEHNVFEVIFTSKNRVPVTTLYRQAHKKSAMDDGSFQNFG